jgi:hypothetical protein
MNQRDDYLIEYKALCALEMKCDEITRDYYVTLEEHYREYIINQYLKER